MLTLKRNVDARFNNRDKFCCSFFKRNRFTFAKCQYVTLSTRNAKTRKNDAVFKDKKQNVILTMKKNGFARFETVS